MRGTGMEMYTECLSAAFVGLSFPAAAQCVALLLLFFLNFVSLLFYFHFTNKTCSVLFESGEII